MITRFGLRIASQGRHYCITLAICFVDLSRRGCKPLTIWESSELALGLGPKTQGGVGRGLALTPYGVMGT
jgi:hypothetical protein